MNRRKPNHIDRMVNMTKGTIANIGFLNETEREIQRSIVVL